MIKVPITDKVAAEEVRTKLTRKGGDIMKRDILIIVVCLSFVFIASCSWTDLLCLTPVGWLPEGVIATIALDAILSEDTAEWLGMKVHNLNNSLSSRYGIDPNEKGVVLIKIKSESVAEQLGFIEGDLVKKINQYETCDINEFYSGSKKVKKAGEVVFDIIRQRNSLTISTGPLRR